jgi:serine/threonine protein kinase
VKVLDFGIAKIHEVLETQTFTHAGEAIGTLGYMSPEQLIGAVVDARSDLFSIGVVVFELLSGKRPFTGRSTAEALASIRLGTPELPGTQTREIYRILAKSMAWDPADRYQTAGALRSELIPALEISSINVNEAASGLSTRTIRHKAAAVRSD